MNNRPEEFDPAKRHLELDYDDERKAVICTRCNKVLEERPFSDHMMMVGAIFIKKNLPCAPVEALSSVGDSHE
jgi:hypothetical protein